LQKQLVRLLDGDVDFATLDFEMRHMEEGLIDLIEEGKGKLAEVFGDFEAVEEVSGSDGGGGGGGGGDSSKDKSSSSSCRFAVAKGSMPIKV